MNPPHLIVDEDVSVVGIDGPELGRPPSFILSHASLRIRIIELQRDRREVGDRGKRLGCVRQYSVQVEVGVGSARYTCGYP